MVLERHDTKLNPSRTYAGTAGVEMSGKQVPYQFLKTRNKRLPRTYIRVFLDLLQCLDFPGGRNMDRYHEVFLSRNHGIGDCVASPLTNRMTSGLNLGDKGTVVLLCLLVSERGIISPKC